MMERRTAEVNTRPYEVVKWSNLDRKRYAIVDMEKFKQGAEDQAVVGFDSDMERLEVSAGILNDRYEGAMNSRVHDSMVITIDAHTAKQIDEIRNYVENQELVKIASKIAKDIFGAKSFEEFTKEEHDSKIVKSAVELVYQSLKAKEGSN